MSFANTPYTLIGNLLFICISVWKGGMAMFWSNYVLSGEGDSKKRGRRGDKATLPPSNADEQGEA